MKLSRLFPLLAFATLINPLFSASEFHVSISGSDENSGTKAAPFRTIQHAAEQAQSGDTITVHEGVYRERINPPRGGSSDGQRIVYQAAPGAEVVIKGSEMIRGWYPAGNATWKSIVPNEFFGDYNPYSTRIAGDWFRPFPRDSGRAYHTGTVYLDGHWLKEAASLEDVLAPATEDALWFAEVDAEHTTIYAQFNGIDPNEHLVEVNARETVFYPEKEGINYITVRGFTMEQAAPNWAPPTAEQVGLIGPHWSKGWIIEDNIIRYSICVGITLGKHGDEYDNTSANSAEGYVATIERALKRGWSKENIGSHIVRNNHISFCEQAGMVGSMGAAFSTISGNTIHDINLRGMLGGAEMAGIKFHGPIDTLIQDNHVYRCGGSGGIWLDWMTQGTRVTGNLLHDNQRSDLFIEVNHGPYLVDHNISLSPEFLRDMSTGGAFVHNLAVGTIEVSPQGRKTPYHQAHSTEIAGLHDIPCGDNRFINNLFLGGKILEPYDTLENMTAEGNDYSDQGVKLVREGEKFFLKFDSPEMFNDGKARSIVTTERLGRTVISGLPFQQADGSDYTLLTDYFGRAGNADNPTPGPFSSDRSTARIKVWPK